MSTAVILYGPKAIGKTYLARILNYELGIYPIDPDEFVLEWKARGLQADPIDGWIEQIFHVTSAALKRFPVVSVEATGAWDSDWKLPKLLEEEGHNLLTIRINAPRSLVMSRLKNREEPRVLVSEQESDWIWDQVELNSKRHSVDLEVNGSDPLWESKVVSHCSHLLRSIPHNTA